MSNTDIFKAAYAKQQAMDAEKKTTNYSSDSGGFVEISWFSLEVGAERMFRIFGKPSIARTKPWEEKHIFYSEILKDDAKGYIKVIWPQTSEKIISEDGTEFLRDRHELDESWIMFRLHKAVTESKFEAYPKGQVDKDGKKGLWNPLHAGKDSYERINTNKAPYQKYPPRVYPSQKRVLPVAGRHDAWCADNNHAQLLTSKQTVSPPKEDGGEPRVFTDWGIPKTLGIHIFEHAAQYSGDWESLDYCIKIEKDGNKNRYIVKDIGERISDEVKALGNDAPITKLEAAYEKYDLDAIFRKTSYNKLLKNLTGLFKQVDADLGTSFYDELVDLAAKEKAEMVAMAESQPAEESEAGQPVEKAEAPQAESQDAVASTAKRRRKPAEAESSSEEPDFKTFFANWDKMPVDEQKAYKDAVGSFTGKVPNYKEGIISVPCDADNCTFDGNTPTTLPEFTGFCPVCGTAFVMQ